MIIKKFQGKTKDEAIELAKKEMGPNVVIMNVKELPAKGLSGLLKLKPGMLEVTAAVEDNQTNSALDKEQEIKPLPKSGFDAVVDDAIELPKGPSLVPPPLGEDWLGAIGEVSKIVQQQPQAKPVPAPAPAPVPTPTPAPAPAPTPTPVYQDNTLIKAKKAVTAMDKYSLAKPEKNQPKESSDEKPQGKNAGYLRMIYNTLLENEVDEKYVNRILDEVGKTLSEGSSIDYLISNIYQKMVLLLGKPAVIKDIKNKPKVVFFIGPTGVGKTTTLSKIAAKYALEGLKVSLLTADTYRIAAFEQLKKYAEIMNLPVDIVYSGAEINQAIENQPEADLVLVDTAGFSHKNQDQKNDLKSLIDSLDEVYDKEVYLVLSSTTKYKDLLEIADSYGEISDYKLIFTKLDETEAYGNILNLKLYTDSDISYAAIGQNVPDDIEILDTQKIVKHLLGGK